MNFLLTAVQKPEDLWHFSGSFSDKPIQFHKEANVASAENDLFTIKAEFTKEKEVFVEKDIIKEVSQDELGNLVLGSQTLDSNAYAWLNKLIIIDNRF